MAPKRSRKGKEISATSSQPPPEAPPPRPYDRSRFVNAEAALIYITMVRRRLVIERGIVNTHPFRQYIERYGWQSLADAQTMYYDKVVREFYANLQFMERGKVFVRGKQVTVTAQAINDAWGLTDYQLDDYTTFKNSDINWDEMVGHITREGTVGPLLANWTHIKRGELKSDVKPWYYFVAHNLMPVTVNSDVYKKRAILTYAITTGLSINVGELIMNELLNMLNPRVQTASLGFPCLISKLCSFHEVPLKADDIPHSPDVKITLELFREPRLQGQRAQADEEDRQDEEGSDADHELPPHPPLIVSQQLSQIQRDITALHQRMDRMDDFITHQVEFNAYLARVLSVTHVTEAGQAPTFQPREP